MPKLRDYLTEVQRHEEQVKAAPARWLPWNYREQLAESFCNGDVPFLLDAPAKARG